jgi:hypothetical protein
MLWLRRGCLEFECGWSRAKSRTSLCRGCGNECQTEVCWCGDTLATHRAWYQGHEFVPYGCTCLFAKGADTAKPAEGE